jgi:hypothetical protein
VDEALLCLLSNPTAAAACGLLLSDESSTPAAAAQQAGAPSGDERGPLAPELLRGCVQRPSAARSRAAALLLHHSAACRRQFPSLLSSSLASATVAGSKSERRTLLALLLGPAVAYLEAELRSSSPAASGASGGAMAVAESLQQPLLAFFSAKQHGPGKPADLAGGDTAAAASRLLHEHAAHCLALALRAAPLETEQLHTAAGKLLPDRGWGVDAVACEPAGLLPSTGDKAAAALALLLSARQPGIATGAAQVLPFVRAFIATLSKLHRWVQFACKSRLPCVHTPPRSLRGLPVHSSCQHTSSSTA